MSEVYLAEIRLFAWARPMRGWMACDGSMLPVREHQALFSLLGSRFGGDGKKTFALPDLRGRHIVGAPPGTTRADHPAATGEYAIAPEDRSRDSGQPFLTLQYCIATTGNYPPRS